jgi:hypothetical protein
LYIARLITKKIGGDIMVESTARGSVISVEMKLDDSDKQESSSHVEETQIELQMSTMNLPKQDIRFTISGETFRKISHASKRTRLPF